MTDSFALARFKARMLPPGAPPPPPPAPRKRTPAERALLLMEAVTMAEIRSAAQLLGLTFNEAYWERARLYDRPVFVVFNALVPPKVVDLSDLAG